MALTLPFRQGLRPIFLCFKFHPSAPVGTRNACAFHSAKTAFFISFSRAVEAFCRKRGNFPFTMT
jgi:hypothetical protein